MKLRLFLEVCVVAKAIKNNINITTKKGIFFMTIASEQVNNGGFRKTVSFKNGFARTSNHIAQSKELSFKAKGLALTISAYNSIPNLTVSKDFLKNHCVDGECCFDSCWKELQEKGFLKTYAYMSSSGKWMFEYELLDEPRCDGITLYRYAKDGTLVSTNKGKCIQKESIEQDTPKKDYPDFHPSPFHSSGFHTSGIDYSDIHYNENDSIDHHTSHIDTKENSKIMSLKNNMKRNSNNNPSINHSITQIETKERLSEDELRDIVNQELKDGQIPYCYQMDKDKMQCAIRILTDWYDIGRENFRTDLEFNAFKMIVQCLTEMAIERSPKKYHGTVVDDGKIVIEKINEAIEQDKNLYDFIYETIDDYVEAVKKKRVYNHWGFMKSVIWSSLHSYKIKMQAIFEQGLHHTMNLIQ